MIVIYHDNCWDGFGAAWVASKLHPEAMFLPAKYGDEPPDVKGEEVLMVDFSYKGPAMDKMASRAKYLKVLDHHKTAQEILKDKPYAIFDMNRSGAGLAWDVLMAGQPRPKLIDYVEDRDLWNWKLPCSKEISAVIASHEKDFRTWDLLRDMIEWDFLGCVTEGQAILRFEKQTVSDICQHVRMVKIGDYEGIPVVNSSAFMSEVGEYLCNKYQDCPFGGYYFDREDGKRQWGLRSKGDFDVSEVAKKLGGGGHKNAAGFITEIPS